MPEEGFLGAFARVVSTFAGGAPDGPRHVWAAISPWVQDLVTNASTRWLRHLVVHIPCDVVWPPPPKRAVHCEASAIAACELCKKPCCLTHAFVSGGGEVCCFACVASIAAERAPKIPGWQERANARAERRAPVDYDPSTGQTRPREPPPRDAPPPPAPETPLDAQYAQARKVLGVKRSATWQEIQAANRELLAKHHPDRQPTPRRRADAERRFKEVRAAYDLLKQAYPEANR